MILFCFLTKLKIDNGRIPYASQNELVGFDLNAIDILVKGSRHHCFDYIDSSIVLKEINKGFLA